MVSRIRVEKWKERLRIAVLSSLAFGASIAGAHGDSQHLEPTTANEAQAQSGVFKMNDLTYVSDVDSAPGGMPSRSVSRLAMADGRLQLSEEFSDGRLVQLRYAHADSPLPDPTQPPSLDRLKIVSNALPDTEPLSELLHQLVVVAQVRDGELIEFSSAGSADDHASRAAFRASFDKAISTVAPQDAKTGLYVQATPYLGRADPDVVFAEGTEQTTHIFSQPFRYHYSDSVDYALIGEKLIVQPGRPVIASIAGQKYAVRAFELRAKR